MRGKFCDPQLVELRVPLTLRADSRRGVAFEFHLA